MEAIANDLDREAHHGRGTVRGDARGAAQPECTGAPAVPTGRD